MLFLILRLRLKLRRANGRQAITISRNSLNSNILSHKRRVMAVVLAMQMAATQTYCLICKTYTGTRCLRALGL